MSRFQKFVAGDEAALHPNLRSTAYQAVLNNSSDASSDFDAIVGIYKTTPSVDQKLSALSSLGSVSDVNLLHRLLTMVLDSESVKPQDIIYPLGSVGQEGPTKTQKLDILWTWVTQNWSLLHERYKASLSLLGRCLQAAISARIGSEFVQTVESWARGDDLATTEAKAQRTDQLKTALRPLEQSLEKVKGYTKWVERERTALAQWVSTNQLA